jgi:hypothetical protein
MSIMAAFAPACGAGDNGVPPLDAAPGSGGAGGSGGGQGTGGSQSGGTSGTGGSETDSSTSEDSKGPPVDCRDDGGSRLATAARKCANDSDCQLVVSATCCGADNAFGVAKTQAEAYATCFGLPPGACQGLGCAKFQGYAVDTGDLTRWDGDTTNPLMQVALHCANDLCTTSVIPPQDAPTD